MADEDKSVAKKFGVLKEKSMYGRKFLGIERTTFVINNEGKITAMISGIKPERHPQSALDALKNQK
jgi:thioredoxin-dependent peroxiredoxin